MWSEITRCWRSFSVSSTAMRNIGLLHEGGCGVPQDYTKAMDWYHKAADAGSADAANNIGALHCYGRGVPQDYTEAMGWWRKAAAAGSAGAMYDIGLLYKDGLGVQQDHTKAVEWWNLAKSSAGEGTATYDRAEKAIRSLGPGERPGGSSRSRER